MLMDRTVLSSARPTSGVDALVYIHVCSISRRWHGIIVVQSMVRCARLDHRATKIEPTEPFLRHVRTCGSRNAGAVVAYTKHGT